MTESSVTTSKFSPRNRPAPFLTYNRASPSKIVNCTKKVSGTNLTLYCFTNDKYIITFNFLINSNDGFMFQNQNLNYYLHTCNIMNIYYTENLLWIQDINH